MGEVFHISMFLWEEDGPDWSSEKKSQSYLNHIERYREGSKSKVWVLLDKESLIFQEYINMFCVSIMQYKKWDTITFNRAYIDDSISKSSLFQCQILLEKIELTHKKLSASHKEVLFHLEYMRNKLRARKVEINYPYEETFT